MKQNLAYRILRKFRDGTLSPQNRTDVECWLLSDQETSEKEEALRLIWDEITGATDASTQESLLSVHRKIKNEEISSFQRFSSNRWLRYAAVLLLPIITGITVFWLSGSYYMDMGMEECYVPHGELRSVTLADGSKVQLNSGTVLIYPRKFKGWKRTVYLSGEAHFQVAKNEREPFIVKTGPLNVEVLGTKFDVESYLGTDRITTTLEEGSVKVYPEREPKRAFILKPDQQVVFYAEADSFSYSHVKASDYTAWTYGELRFRNKTLNEILATLERRYNVNFLVDEKIISTDLYSIKFKSHETIEDALHVFSLIVGNITYRKEGQTIRLYPKGKEVKP